MVWAMIWCEVVLHSSLGIACQDICRITHAGARFQIVSVLCHQRQIMSHHLNPVHRVQIHQMILMFVGNITFRQMEKRVKALI